jgi:hypothetical protein
MHKGNIEEGDALSSRQNRSLPAPHFIRCDRVSSLDVQLAIAVRPYFATDGVLTLLGPITLMMHSHASIVPMLSKRQDEGQKLQIPPMTKEITETVISPAQAGRIFPQHGSILSYLIWCGWLSLLERGDEGGKFGHRTSVK